MNKIPKNNDKKTEKVFVQEFNCFLPTSLSKLNSKVSNECVKVEAELLCIAT